MFSSKKPIVDSTPFSDFIRNARSSEKKRVYTEVMKKATERQRNTIRKARESVT